MDNPKDEHHAGTTGDPVVDEELEVLDVLEGLPVEEHQAVFSAVHEALQRTLDEDPAQA
ncbi:hypothetical protein ACTXOR_06260 [Arthrobacter rhombi]|uniref:Uncharacterized protein n=1 Tax=Arthrobacter rhombi TaxID=71253 RepID=A0A1R4F1Y8_9MICC|nr:MULTISPECIES: hypothetical protein [Micrococcaceae]SJM49895.1 hypothetical protein FM101_01845 [Arthrobacter rhombi]